ncbi:HHL146Cp [Eremothecium sinecaudum]|uniref:HHL146Cp n=1 Tax=Eremothecium sinecaudum TaxID=45286 RepID=A0A0X8HW69_9SACH|nr:HHL146Cp [Eremothecium sinecaudum]AMD22624.1 HHL146Cp [Eremothecium sinecaudum]
MGNKDAQPEAHMFLSESTMTEQFYTTKKMQSEYWNLNTGAVPSALAVEPENGVIMVSYKDGTDENLRLFRYNSDKGKMQELQSVSIPGEKIVLCELLGPKYIQAMKKREDKICSYHDQLILTAHADGVVNLISTSLELGDAKVIRRFNHKRYLRNELVVGDDKCAFNSSDCENEQVKSTTHIRELKPWFGESTCNMGFASVIGDHLFVCEFANNRYPIFQRHCPGITAIDLNPENVSLLAMAGAKYGKNGIAICDFSKGSTSGSLFVAANERVSCASELTSRGCLWLDTGTLVTVSGNNI